MRSNRRAIASAAALLIGSVGAACPGSAHAQEFTKNVYSFTGGAIPNTDLAADSAGNLYGFTANGGPRPGNCVQGNHARCATIYELIPPAAKGDSWTEQTLYVFDSAVSGNYTYGKPLLDAAGNIYGTTAGGGTVGGQPGGGTVWKLSPPAVSGNPWNLTVLYTFGPAAESVSVPSSGLVMDRSGTPYGTTYFGGTFGRGIVFSLTPPPAGGSTWTEAVLHSFGAKNDAINPLNNPLVLSADQQTLSGGTSTWVKANGTYGSGAIYRLHRQGSAWSYSVLYRFTGTAGGTDPVGGLVLDSNDNLFGATNGGGAFGGGTVFELSPPAPGQTAWTEQVLHSFTGADGAEPRAGLVSGGKPRALFGTTYAGGQGGAVDGSTGSQGVTFRLDPPASGSGPWSYTELHAFAAGANGRGGAGDIITGLTFGLKGRLFGVAASGGTRGQGAVFVQTQY